MPGTTTKSRMVCMRLKIEEIAKLKHLIATIQVKNPFIKDADVYRELLGLTNFGFIPQEMREGLAHPLPKNLQQLADKVMK